MYVPYEVREEAETRSQEQQVVYVNLAARNKSHDFVPLVAESLGGLSWEGAAIKLFAEIAKSQASPRHPVGHILRRLI